MNIIEKPNQLFIIDGIGAMVSAFMLGVVLVHFESIFGIPKSTLYFLAALPCLFAIFDLYAYNQPKRSIATFLKAIAIINILYCCISISAAFYHKEMITFFGILYIVLEIIIVMLLAVVELKTVQKIVKEDE